MYRYSFALIILAFCACAKPNKDLAQIIKPNIVFEDKLSSKRANDDEMLIKAELATNATQKFKAYYELYKSTAEPSYLLAATKAYMHTCQAANIDYGCIDSEFEQKLFQLYPNKKESIILKIHQYLAASKLKPARLQIVNLIKRYPDDAELYQLALKAQMPYAVLLKVLKKPNKVQFFYLAQLAISQGDFKAALRLVKNQDDLSSDLIRLQALLGLNKDPQSIHELAMKLGDGALSLHEQIANVLLNLQRPDLALFYAKANSLEQIRANLALKDYAKASVALRKRYEKTKEPLELIYSKIYALMSGFSSQKELDELISQYGASADALNSYGYYLISNTKDVAKGLALVRKALKQEPNNVYYLDSLAWGLYKLGRCNQAKDAIDRAIFIGVSDEAILELMEHKKEIEKCLH